MRDIINKSTVYNRYEVLFLLIIKKYLYDGFLLLSKFYYYTKKIAYTHICLFLHLLELTFIKTLKTGYLK